MQERFHKWITEKFRKSDNTLFNKLAKSMERDKDVPVRYVLQKGLIYIFSLMTAPLNLKQCDEVGKRVRTRRKPYIENMGAIHIGDDVNINSRNVQTDLVSGPNGTLEIGDAVSINFGVSIVANENVKIGNRVRIGPHTMIYDSDLHIHGERYKRASGSKVVIEDDVWLASRSMVLQGSRIGKGSLIASGSIVSGVIPPYVVAAGSPAKIIKFLTPPVNSGFLWERTTEDVTELNPSVIKRVKKVARETLGLKEISDVDIKTTFQDLSDSWDSFQHIKFLNALENEFSIDIKNMDITRINSIKKACKIIQCQLMEINRKATNNGQKLYTQKYL